MDRQLRGIELKRFLRKYPKHDLEIVFILENIQYARNVAEMFRIADSLKIKKIILAGISIQPPFGKDLMKVSREKEKSVAWEYSKNIYRDIKKLQTAGYQVIALELTENATEITEFVEQNKSNNKFAIIVGNEAYGINKKTLELTNQSVYLPMFGKGASLNVSVSLAVASYFLILR